VIALAKLITLIVIANLALAAFDSTKDPRI